MARDVSQESGRQYILQSKKTPRSWSKYLIKWLAVKKVAYLYLVKLRGKTLRQAMHAIRIIDVLPHTLSEPY